MQVARKPLRKVDMKWETPKLIILAYQQAHGACNPGSAETAGNCTVGPSAVGQKCETGGSAGNQCYDGGSATNKCGFGSIPKK